MNMALATCSRVTRPISFGLLLWFFSLTLGTVACAERDGVLWKPIAWTGKLYLPSQAKSHRVFEVDLEQFEAPTTKRLELPLPDGRSIAIVKTREERARDGAFVWQGKVEGDDHSIATFSRVGDALVGDVVTSSGQMYRMDHVAPRTVVIMELDPRKFPREGHVEPAPKTHGALQEIVARSLSCPRDSADRIDVMVLYTEAACAAASNSLDQCTDSGRNAIEAKIYVAVSEANQTYMNSFISQRLSLVHIDSVGPYSEATTLPDDLERLHLYDADETASTNDTPYLDIAHELREQYAADVVALVTRPANRYPGGAADGLATPMRVNAASQEQQAFAVIPWDSATGIFGFTHELGHIMGTDHDIGTSGNTPPFSWSHGFAQPNPTGGATPFRTVMAYSTTCPLGCVRLPYWSNPDTNQFYQGNAMGDARADSHKVLNDTDETVANYRSSSACGEDVWMKDTWQDLGREPDPAQADKPMWKSPYIWIRNQRDPDGGKRFQHLHENPVSGRTNWAYVKVHNGGLSSSGTLELRIAQASTGLIWPTSWTVIGSQPLSLSANSTTIAEFRLDGLPGAGQYCLIARWLSAADPMTTLEGSLIEPNVRSNNNIIWRNVSIVDLTLSPAVLASVKVANPTDAMMRTWIEIFSSLTEGRSFLEFGEIRIELDQALAKVWSKANSAGRGLEIDGRTVRMTSARAAAFRDLQLPPGFEGTLKVTFRRPEERDFPKGTFTIDVVQSRVAGGRKEVVGGVTYEVHTDSRK